MKVKFAELPAIIAGSDRDNSAACGGNQTFSYAWTIVSRPAGSSATLSDPTAAAPTTTPDKGGVYNFRVTVTDSTGRSSAPAFANLNISTCGANPPVIAAISPSSGTRGIPIGASVTVVDSNCLNTSQSFSYAWTLIAPPGSSALLNNPRAAAPQFVPDIPGKYQLGLTATNPQGISSAPVVQNVSVSDCVNAPLVWGSPPVTFKVVSDPDGVISSINTGAQLMLTGNAAEPAGNTCGSVSLGAITVSWSLVSAPAGSHASLSSNVGTPGRTAWSAR